MRRFLIPITLAMALAACSAADSAASENAAAAAQQTSNTGTSNAGTTPPGQSQQSDKAQDPNKTEAEQSKATDPDANAEAPKVDTKLVSCGADKVQSYVGAKPSDAVKADVAQRSGAKAIRWITPNMMVTMDFSDTRLNARIGTDGNIGSFDCG